MIEEINSKHIDAMKLLGEVEDQEFLCILSNYFNAKAKFIKYISELEESYKKRKENKK